MDSISQEDQFLVNCLRVEFPKQTERLSVKWKRKIVGGEGRNMAKAQTFRGLKTAAADTPTQDHCIHPTPAFVKD